MTPAERMLRDRVDELEERLRQLLAPPPADLQPLRRAGVRLSRAERAIFALLLRAQGGVVPYGSVALACARGDEIASLGTIRVLVCNLRDKLAPLGWTISAEYRVGYRMERTGQDTPVDALGGPPQPQVASAGTVTLPEAAPGRVARSQEAGVA